VAIADSIEQLEHCLTAADLSRLLNVHKLTIYRLAKAGTLPSFRLGTCVRFDPRAVAKWLRDRGTL
jgi:excisionase family DNA binding protein